VFATVTLRVVAPDGRETTLAVPAERRVYAAAREAAEALGLRGGAWTLARGTRSVAAVPGLADAGVRDGETLDLRSL
jgi:hypothetical protein